MNIRSFTHSLMAAVFAVALMLSFHTPARAQAGRGGILYLKTGQHGTNYSLYAGDSTHDSAGVAKAWAGVKDSGYLMPGHIAVVFAKYYYPAHLNASDRFVWGTLLDSTGTVPGPNATALAALLPTNGQLLIGRASDHKFALQTLTGTTSEIVVTNGAGTVTLSTPQAIATSSSPAFASVALSATSNQLVLGAVRTATITAPTPASASRAYTIPDPGADASFVMTAANQTIAGVKTFSSGVPITATTNQIVLGAASHLLTVSSPAIAAASQTYTIPDVKKAGTFTMIVAVPDSATAVGVAGAIAYDTSYLYICVTSGAAGSAAWKRISLAW